MKWLIYLLLLLNIGLFAWHFRGVSPASSTSTDTLPAGVTRLVLLREQQPDQEKQWCYSLGPLLSPEQADALNQQLHEWKLDSWTRKSKEAKRKGYWVLLPPLSTRAEARAVVEQLKVKNITDYFLVATGEKANGISLGVFSKFESAHRRIKQMNSLGFKPVMEEVKLPAEEYWLDWLRDKGKSLSKDRLTQLQQEYAGLKQVERSCELPVSRAADAANS
jgi:hypothetical protein